MYNYLFTINYLDYYNSGLEDICIYRHPLIAISRTSIQNCWCYLFCLLDICRIYLVSRLLCWGIRAIHIVCMIQTGLQHLVSCIFSQLDIYSRLFHRLTLEIYIGNHLRRYSLPYLSCILCSFLCNRMSPRDTSEEDRLYNCQLDLFRCPLTFYD